MKTIYHLIYLAYAGILFLTGCSDDILEKNAQVIEGQPTKVNLNFGVANSSQLSRATSPVKDEHKVNNLYVFIFNADGSLSKSQFFEYGNLQDKMEKDDINNTLTSGKVTIETVSGSGKTIWAIANIANVSTNAMRDITPAVLDEISNLEELQALTASLQQETIARGTAFLMSGTHEDASGNPKKVDIPVGGEISGNIILKRVDAKITFNIQTKKGITFTPTEWKVVKASKKVYLLPNASDPEGADTDYFETSWANYEGEGDNFGKTFSFYVAENRKSPIKSIPTMTEDGTPLTPEEQYNYREKQLKNPVTDGKPGQTVTNGAYEYADPNSTYVILKGNITYKYGEIQEVSANVVYTIHLGFVNGAEDFNTNRNVHYTYTVTINSAESIIVEVNDGKENQPGAEGEITIADNIINLDAHYETRCITFTQAQIDPSLTWYVKTAFSEGMPEQNPQDYKWIKFLLNTKNVSSYDTKFQKYPGDAKSYTDEEIEALDCQITNAKLINVAQLVRILKRNKEIYIANNNSNKGTLFDGGFKITFTAFIEENYYTQNPETGDNSTTLWKKFVNQPERIMNILSNTRYSPDGESVRHVAVTSFRQKSIQTMYNISAGEGLQTAWGTECVQETDKRPFWKEKTANNSGVPTYNDSRNGRSNTIKLWNTSTNPRWDTYIEPTTNEMKTVYNYARYNCMQRNRDLDGDGEIDADEVRWYLAAIDQLTDLWIGENSFDADARLFKGSTWIEDWYVSSTVPGRYSVNIGSDWFPRYEYWDNPTVLWSSEGSSIGEMNTVTSYNTSKTFNYRCVRNLGIAPDDATTIPQDFATYDATTHVLSLEYLDEKSIRAYSQEEELPEHHERQADNLPWWNFEVNPGSHLLPSGIANWIKIRDAVNSGKSPCPPGWRVPNQRELALMLSRVKNDGGWEWSNHMSRTRFSMNPTGGYRHGFSVTSAAEMLFLINNSNETGGVRCVRDKSSK